MRHSGNPPVGEEPVAIVVDGLSKRYPPPPELPGGGIDHLQPPGPWTPSSEDDLIADDDDDVAEPDDDDDGSEADHGASTRVWALKDVSFDVAAGDALGVIGPALAGKTTLLKVLAQVSRPTEGRVALRGRVAPLLGSAERLLVADLDVRRNVRLLATLLGCPSDVATHRLPEILSFADLGEPGRAPLRRLPREARRRLACATALHLDADILLLDDVFGANELGFRERCLRRVEDELARGLTVVLASDRPEIVDRLCRTAVWLDAGELRAVGRAADLIERYRTERGEVKRARIASRRSGSQQGDDPAPLAAKPATVVAAGVLPAEESPSGEGGSADVLQIEVLLAVRAAPAELGLDLRLKKGDWPRGDHRCTVARPGTYRARVTLAAPSLPPGGVSVRVVVWTRVAGEEDRHTCESGPLELVGYDDDTLDAEQRGGRPVDPRSPVWELDYVGSWTFDDGMARD